MYSDTDLDNAAASGAISYDAVAALRDFIATGQAAPVADEEHFRLITGFNDIFVSIAAALLLLAVGWIGQMVPIGVADGPRPLGGLAVAATAWALAEFFTRARRMALPSILLLLAFVGGVFEGVAGLFLPILHPVSSLGTDSGVALMITIAAAAAAGAAYLHWRRFRVPITVAAGAAALVALSLGLLAIVAPLMVERGMRAFGFVAGCAVFMLAMWWDMSDPTRRTRRSDVAFWLHLLAAPLIVHPVFTALAATDGSASIGLAVAVLAVYVLLGMVALAIDRRALMVSALAYVLIAVGHLFERAGAVSLNIALTALVIGSALLLLSAFWHAARAIVVGALPGSIRGRLPPVAGLSPRSA